MKKLHQLLMKWQKQQEIYRKSQEIYDGFFSLRYEIQGSNHSAKGYKDDFLKENKLAGGYDIYKIGISSNY